MENTNIVTLDEAGKLKEKTILETVKNETLPQKNEAAVALGKLRWANKSDEDKRKHMSMMGIASGKKKAKVRPEEELEISFTA